MINYVGKKGGFRNMSRMKGGLDIVGEGMAKGSELVPVVTTREYPTQAEDHDEKHPCTQRKSQGRP